MCIGMAAGLGLAISAASAVVGFMGQQQQAAHQQQLADVNAENAATATRDQHDAINNRVLQENAAASQKAFAVSREAAQARGTERAAGAAANVAGLSTDAIMADIYRGELQYRSDLQTNFDYTRDYWTAQGKAATAQGQNQLNSVPNAIKPSFAGAGLRILGAASDAFYPQN